jgi:hypothetical protein
VLPSLSRMKAIHSSLPAGPSVSSAWLKITCGSLTTSTRSPLRAEIDWFLDEAESLGFTARIRLATGSQVPARLLIQTGRPMNALTPG